MTWLLVILTNILKIESKNEVIFIFKWCILLVLLIWVRIIIQEKNLFQSWSLWSFVWWLR